MSTLTRRLQILLDEGRYALLERAAEDRGVSVASLVRDAIDRMFAAGEADRAAAGRRLLEAPPMPIESWEVEKARMIAEMAEPR